MTSRKYNICKDCTNPLEGEVSLDFKFEGLFICNVCGDSLENISTVAKIESREHKIIRWTWEIEHLSTSIEKLKREFKATVHWVQAKEQLKEYIEELENEINHLKKGAVC